MDDQLTVKKPDLGNPQTQYKLKTKNLSYRLPPRCHQLSFSPTCATKLILNHVDCDARPGELTAIAGPSGAGKTTLLEILAGMAVPGGVAGHVLVNDMAMNVAHFRRVSGYVTQDDALFPLLTVEETLTYSARLRLRPGANKV